MKEKKKDKIYYYGFYRIKKGVMECIVTYGLREGLKWQVKGYTLCSWGNTRLQATNVIKEVAREKGYII